MLEKNKLVKILSIALLVFVIQGCRTAPLALRPLSGVFDMMPQNASVNFKKGWVDGCKSGLGSMTNSYYRSFYKFEQDKSLLRDPDYYQAWKDTFTFCRHYSYGIIRQSDGRMRNPTQSPSGFERVGFLTSGAHNLLDYNVLNLWGPGKAGQILEHYGVTAGNGFFEQAGSIDFSNKMLLGKKPGASGFGGNMTWDFRPDQQIVPY